MRAKSRRNGRCSRGWELVVGAAAVVMVLSAVAGCPPACSAENITLQTPKARVTLSEDGRWVSVIDTATGRECIRPNDSRPLADVRCNGKTHPVNSLQRTDDGLALEFEGTDTVLQYEVVESEDWLLFRLSSVKGRRPSKVTILQVPVAINAHIGRTLNIGWDERTAVCLMAANFQPYCRARGKRHAVLRASTQDAPGPQLEGAAVALIVCPTEQFRGIAQRLSDEFNILPNEASDGTPAKNTDMVRGSYWFLAFGPHNVDRVIEYCKKAGIHQVMMSSSSWCRNVGHYTFKDRYPNGADTLKKVVDRLHNNDILVGMHCFVSKVSKTDSYVTPIPDRRFWKDKQDVLGEDITTDAETITVRGDLSQWAGSPVADRNYWEGGVHKHRECIIGDEIIKYNRIGPKGEWNRFIGCQRGAWGTNAAPHVVGDTVLHFGVDGCINGYIIDQETDLMDEVADRIAGIFNHCDFDMVYFDGGEDVNRRRFHYYSTNFQRQAMKRFEKRPIIHMGTVLTHRLWHSFARSGTVDTYLNTLRGAIAGGRTIEEWPTVKEHIDRSVRRARAMHDNMLVGELGWFGIWSKGENTDGLQLDEMEYLMCKSLALDAPVSLQTGFRAMEAHPLTPEILNIFAEYEQLRMEGGVGAEVRKRLGEVGRDFIMLHDGEKRRFVQVEKVPKIGGTDDVRAFVGKPDDGGSVATLWHHAGKPGHVTMDIQPDDLRVTTFTGTEIEFKSIPEGTVVPFGATRNTLMCESVAAQKLREALESANVWVRPPTLIFVDADDYTELKGRMATGNDAGIDEPEALSEVIVCTDRPNRSKVRDWYAEYEVDIPHQGRWTVWARVRYPSATDHSFGIVRPGETVTLSLKQVLGNCGVNEGNWHWTGRGFGVKSVPPGRPITFNLDKGQFTFRVYAREGPGTIAGNPRLDLLCLTDDPEFMPDDERARKWLTE